MYRDGLGVAQDYAVAARWYRLAADQGDTFAQHNLGLMYANGDGVVQDYATAHMWLNIAASNGQEKAREDLNNVAKIMTANTLAEAQKRARLCIESGYQDCN